jgi:23S rRNA (adenine2030-N6)-methyltransferase
MQYRHAFHAGNFADVHKHIALLLLIGSLQKKVKGFHLLDTHAGEGLYDLHGDEARRGIESAAGITRLATTAAEAGVAVLPPVRHYLEVVAQLRKVHGGTSLYPGSPLLAAAVLRTVDTATCVESQAPVARALQRALDAGAAYRAVTPRVLNADGYRSLRAQLPPPTRRGLVLIDPPYESRDEEEQVAAALAEGLSRFETGVFAVWYPVKKLRDAELWVARVIRGIERPTLAAEFCLHEADNSAALNGSGMLVVNPPFGFDNATQAWQAQLESLLGARGGSRVRWLVR